MDIAGNAGKCCLALCPEREWTRLEGKVLLSLFYELATISHLIAKWWAFPWEKHCLLLFQGPLNFAQVLTCRKYSTYPCYVGLNWSRTLQQNGEQFLNTLSLLWHFLASCISGQAFPSGWKLTAGIPAPAPRWCHIVRLFLARMAALHPVEYSFSVVYSVG